MTQISEELVTLLPRAERKPAAREADGALAQHDAGKLVLPAPLCDRAVGGAMVV